MGVIGQAFVKIKPDTSGFAPAVTSQVEGATKAAESAGSKLGSVFGIGMATAAAAGVFEFGKHIFEATDQFEMAHARLVTATTDIGQNFDSMSGAVKKTDSQMENLGFTNAETESSLATLTTVTKSLKTATELEGLAANVAAGRHISLASATSILAKVETGHVALLGRLGIQTKDATGKTISQQQAIAMLTKLYAGQAQAAADTFGGKVHVLGVKLEDVGVAIGMKVIPVVTSLVSGLVSGAQKIQDFNSATGGMAGKVAVATLGLAGMVYVALKVGAVIGTVIDKISNLVVYARVLASEAADAAGGVGALGLAAGGAATVVALTGAAIAFAWHEADQLDAHIQKLTRDLDLGGQAARDATTSFTNMIGGNATSALDDYRIAVENNASSAQLAAEKTKVWRDVLAEHHIQVDSFGNALNTSDTQLRLWKTEVDDATNAIDQQKNAVKDAQFFQDKLTSAQTAYKNDLAGGHATQQQLASDRADVVTASKDLENIQNKVNTATQAGTAAADGNTTATQAQKDAAKAAATAAKDYKKSQDDLAVALGYSKQYTEDLTASLHLAKPAVDELKAEADNLNKAIVTDFDTSKTVIDDFSKQSRVNIKQFESDLLANTIAVANWSSNMKILAHAGLNEGFYQELVDAGAKSAPVVQALVDNIKNGSIKNINAIVAYGKQQGIALQQASSNVVLTSEAQLQQLVNFYQRTPVTVYFNTTKTGSASSIGAPGFGQGAVTYTKPGAAHGGIASGPSSGYGMLLHGTEAILPLNDPTRSMQVLGMVGRFLGGGGGSAATGASLTVVLSPMFPPGMNQEQTIAAMRSIAVNEVAGAVSSLVGHVRVRSGSG